MEMHSDGPAKSLRKSDKEAEALLVRTEKWNKVLYRLGFRLCISTPSYKAVLFKYQEQGFNEP